MIELVENWLFFRRIDDILEDSDSDLPNDSGDEMDDKKTKGTKKSKKTFIKEAPEEIVDLADIRSIGNVLSEFFISLHYI